LIFPYGYEKEEEKHNRSNKASHGHHSDTKCVDMEMMKYSVGSVCNWWLLRGRVRAIIAMIEMKEISKMKNHC
jgi:hypothetical protein